MEQTKRVSRIARLMFTHFNYLHHTYLTPHRLHRMFPGVAPTCPWCGHADATFIHMAWDCPMLAQAWEQVMENISAVVDTPIPPDPMLWLLGITKGTKSTKCYMKLVDLAMIL